MIEITKLNESYYRVVSNNMIEQEIKDFFTFKVPGHQFSPKFKARLWDGTISLYDSRSRRLPSGLLRQLERFVKESEYEMEFRPNERYSELESFDDVTIDEVKDFIDSLDLTSKGKRIEVRDYQYEAVHKAIRNPKITLISPTSSGKSLIIYCLLQWMLDKNPDSRIALIVPNVQLVEQMYSDFLDYSAINEMPVHKIFQRLYAGKDKRINFPVLISTWQSLSSIIRGAGAELLTKFTGVIVDEAHGATGKELQSVLEKMTNAVFRAGTTGTIQNEKVHKLVIEGFLGPSHQVITTKQLIDNKQVSGIRIQPVVLDYSAEDRVFCKKFNYQDETTFIITHPDRLTKVAKAVCGLQGTTLVLVSRRDDHAVPLHNEVLKYANKPVYYVSGTVDAEDRELIRAKANTEDCIIVATFKTMSTGTNIPNIRNVVFGSTSKSMITVLQSIGRGLRLHTDKAKMTLIDFIDDIRYKSHDNYAYQHSEVRMRIYRKEQFDISQPVKVKL